MHIHFLPCKESKHLNLQVLNDLIIYTVYTTKLAHVELTADAWRWTVPATLSVTVSFLNFISLTKAQLIS
jgi:hypothetical protein